MRVEVGAIAPRPPFWVLYTSNPPTSPSTKATGPRQATLRHSWWTIPETNRLQMYAFPHPSHQMRHKVRAATLRSMHHTFLYRRLILQARELWGAHRSDREGTAHAATEKTQRGHQPPKMCIRAAIYIMVNWPIDTDMHQRANVPYAIYPTHAHTLRESARHTKTPPH
jgi:hypothetical protein